ncbi:MAG: M18 family aminopeptidase [Clostridia bacterium]|nr:M18 family aminopeptidase [Clostridia bacterium]
MSEQENTNDLLQAQKLISFIQQSPTSFHAIETIEKELAGFTPLSEREAWRLQPGGKYYVTRNRSSVIAFTLPQGPFRAFQLIASHSDSPTFKIKENAEVAVRDKYVQLDTERYGGMIMSSWFDRPLSIAGRVIVRGEMGVRTVLVNLDRDMTIIPNVAIHMNREVNNGYKFNPAVDTFPLWGSQEAKNTFKAEIAKAAGVEEKDVLGADLFLYNRVPGTVWGVKNEYLSAPRLDDLECAFSSLEAFKAAKPGNHVNVCCVFDNEEVGSTTKQGAHSTFLSDTLRRIVLSLGGNEESYYAALASSFMLSADNAHAVHPNHPEYSDSVNQVWMNKGIVVKFNANQKYTTDAVSEAVFHAICEKAGVPVQHYANRSDLAGGGTLGNISGSHVSINTLDIGLAQLAMHSCYETAGVQDVDYMIRGMRAFYETEIESLNDGQYQLG